MYYCKTDLRIQPLSSYFALFVYACYSLLYLICECLICNDILINMSAGVDAYRRILEHIGRLARMSVSGYRGRQFEPRQQYVVSLSKTLYPHCFSRLSYEMSTRWGQPREGCSVL